jgi:hypothetical protein
LFLFDPEAQEAFYGWRNTLDQYKEFLPPPMRGFIPKAVSYVVRLSGIIHCLHAFARPSSPERFITLQEVTNAIKIVGFHLGQTVEVLELFADESHTPQSADQRVLTLAQTLEALKAVTDNGRLAVSFVMEKFNSEVPKEQRFKSAKAFGAFVRSNELPVTDSLHDANGKSRVRCLIWDQRIETFIKNGLKGSRVPAEGDSKKSSDSASSPDLIVGDKRKEDVETEDASRFMAWLNDGLSLSESGQTENS